MPNLEDWTIEQGLKGPSIAALLSGFSERLVGEGIPLFRSYVALPTVNPTFRVYNHTWTRQTGVSVEGVSHERNDGAFEVSPFGYMLRSGLIEQHWSLEGTGPQLFEIFDDIKREGGTDYLARLIPFENTTAPGLRGIAASFSSDRTGGFTPAEVARIEAILPLLALAAYRITLLDLAVSTLDTYVGLSAGRRVLSGEIRRGSGTTLTAALYVADLRGFTTVTDAAGVDVIARLDRHFEAMADPVTERGGEVLKFMGDGLLAAFPITDDIPREKACAAAIEAAMAALQRNDTVNRRHAGETPLQLDIALHCGDVFYGNIGTESRLDFTVIGPAVNEASRMEALCKELDCAVVMSDSVASASPVSVRSLGRHRLRGVAAERELFTLDPANVAKGGSSAP